MVIFFKSFNVLDACVLYFYFIIMIYRKISSLFILPTLALVRICEDLADSLIRVSQGCNESVSWDCGLI